MVVVVVPGIEITMEALPQPPTTSWNMLGRAYHRVRRFLSEHRKGLLCLALTGGVAAYGVYRVGRGYQQLQESSLYRLRLQGAYESAQSMYADAVGSMVSKLNEAITRLVPIPSTNSLRDSLKRPPSDGQERYSLWNHCKTQTFARLVVGVYGVVLLATFLRVEVNLLGRYLYLENLLAKDPSARMTIPLEVVIPQLTQKRYLAHAEYMIHTGLPQLVAHAQNAAQHALADYPLERGCTYDDVLAIVDAIRRKMEQPTTTDSNETLLNTFLLPQENDEEGKADEEGQPRDHKLIMLINETRDILESTAFNRTLSRCLNLGFFTLSQQLHSCFLRPLEGQLAMSRDLAILPSQQVTVPMARLLALINGHVSKFLASSPNPLLETFLRDDDVGQYTFDLFTAANIE